MAALGKSNPEEVSARSQAPYAGGSFRLTFLNRIYRVSFPGGTVTAEDGEATASLYQAILILHYLVTANGRPLTGEWVSFRHLPGGDIYREPFEKRAIIPFIKTFGSRPEEFTRAAAALGGSTGPFPGVNAVIPVFARVPLAFVLWPGDDEFPASANILFDGAAASYLPTEDYAHLPALVIGTLQREVKGER